MAQEIENCLMAKYIRVLKNENSSSRLCCYKQFEDIKKLLQEKLQSSLSEDGKNSLREKLYLLNNILGEWQTISRERNWYTPHELVTLYHIERNLSKITGELGQINGLAAVAPQTQNGHQASSSTAGEISQSTSESVDALKVTVHGFDNQVLSLEKLIFQKESDNVQFKAIGIVGTGGIGKTTLCQVIFNKQEIKNQFIPRIWVCMSRRPDDSQDRRTTIVKIMLTELGLEGKKIESISTNHGLPGLLCALHQELAGKKYLIVLDDAVESDDWYEQLNSCVTRDKKWDGQLAYGLPKGYGGTVIVTSRNEDTAKKMVGEKSLHNLQPLSDSESCWKIFKDAVGENNAAFITSYEEDLKKEIIQKSGGVPLAAKLIGQIMREWKPENKSTAAPSEINQHMKTTGSF